MARNLITRLTLSAACVVADVVSWCFMFPAAIVGAKKWIRIAVAKDQALNASFNGSEDETVSSRAARARDRGERWGCVLCKWLGRIDPDHCDRAKGV
jgi:predicted deacylase